MRLLSTVILLCLSLLAGPTLADAAPASPPAHDGQHDFDFDTGVWHTHIRRILDPFAGDSASIELAGTVTVRKVWGGKAELEEVEVDGPKGHWEGLSLLLYNPTAHQWSQSYVNSKVGAFSPSASTVGGFKDGRGVLVGEDSTTYDETILVKVVYSDIKPDSHRYEEWYSHDGGASWVLSFTADLTRSKQ
jgi:hypothetical protein